MELFELRDQDLSSEQTVINFTAFLHANSWQKDFVEKGITEIEETTALTTGTCELDLGVGMMKNWEITKQFQSEIQRIEFSTSHTTK